MFLPSALCFMFFFLFFFLKTVTNIYFLKLIFFYGECRGDESGYRYGNEMVM